MEWPRLTTAASVGGLFLRSEEQQVTARRAALHLSQIGATCGAIFLAHKQKARRVAGLFMLDKLQPAVSRRRERRNKTPKPIAKSDSIVGSSTATGLIEYVNSSVVTETLKSPSELRKHQASASTHGPPMVDTPSRFGTPNNRGKKPPSGNRRPDDEMTSSYCSKPSPVSSNKTSKPKSGSVGLTASSCNVIAFAVPKKLNRRLRAKSA